ncbi:MAG: hypothetical protein H7Y20_14960 [Bryobacteraceae bacterium]|nr:hypothetical protein [Bryobacteraceae bacterium]
MNRRFFLSSLSLASALQAQRPDTEGKLYFDVVRDIYPVRTGIKRLARKDLSFPTLGEFQVVTGDFHVHTLYSEGTVMPSVRLYEAWTEGVDVLAITDHAEFLRTSLPEKRGRAYDEVLELARALNLVLIRGAEVSTVYTADNELMSDVVARKNTDFIVLFVTDENALFAPFDVAMERAKQQGCLNIWAHPGHDWRPIPQKFLDQGWLHGIEIRNTVTSGGSGAEEYRGSYFYPRVAEWAEEKNVALIASSDVHSPAEFERLPRAKRDYTLLLVRDRSPEAVREAILARRTMTWFDDMLWGSAEHLTSLLQHSVAIRGMWTEKRLGGLQIHNRCSFPFEIHFVPGQDGWRLPSRSVSLEPLGSTVVPAPRNSLTPVRDVAVRVTNMFTKRDNMVETRLPIG